MGSGASVSAEAPSAARARRATLKSGESVAYRERGSGASDRTLLCLHGMRMSAADFEPFVDALELPESVRVLVPDAPGHGSRLWPAHALGGERPGCRAAERVADVLAFLEAVGGGGGPVDVLGYSMGGATALSLAADHSESVGRVCLVAPAVAFTEECIDERRRGDAAVAYSSEEEALRFLESIGLHSDVARELAPGLAVARSGVDEKEYWRQRWAELLADTGDAPSGEAAGAMLEGCREAAARAAASGKELAVIQGSADRIVHRDVPRTIKAAMGKARCEVAILRGLGHFGHPRDAEEWMATAAAGPVAEFFAYE